MFLHFPSACPKFFRTRTTGLPNSLSEILHPFKKWSSVSFSKGVYYTAPFQDVVGVRCIPCGMALQHSCPTLTEGFQVTEAAASSHAAHTRAEPHNPSAQSWAALNYSSSSPGKDGHSTQQETRRIPPPRGALCWAIMLALKWELNLLHQANSVWLLPAQQSPNTVPGQTALPLPTSPFPH